MGKFLFVSLLAFLAIFVSFSQAADSDFSYARELVMRDCGQTQFALANRTEFSQFYGRPVDSNSIQNIIQTASDLSKTDPLAQDSPAVYFSCGTNVMSAQNGTLFWKGLEISTPQYIQDVIDQSDYLEHRQLLLEQDVAQLRDENDRTNNYLKVALGTTLVLIFLILALGHFWVRDSKKGAKEKPAEIPKGKSLVARVRKKISRK